MKKETIDKNSLAHTSWNCKYHNPFSLSSIISFSYCSMWRYLLCIKIPPMAEEKSDCHRRAFFNDPFYEFYSISRWRASGTALVFLGRFSFSTPLSYLAVMASALMFERSNSRLKEP